MVCAEALAGRLPQGWLGELKRRAVLRDLILLRHVLMTEMRDVHEIRSHALLRHIYH